MCKFEIYVFVFLFFIKSIKGEWVNEYRKTKDWRNKAGSLTILYFTDIKPKDEDSSIAGPAVVHARDSFKIHEDMRGKLKHVRQNKGKLNFTSLNLQGSGDYICVIAFK